MLGYRKRWGALFGLVTLAMACGTSTSSGPVGAPQGPHGELIIAAVAPFSGPDADFGPSAMAGCIPAAALINQDGGVLGSTLKCQSVDTRGDPADAVPALDQLLATTPNLVAIVGPTSDESTALAPIINAAKIPFSPSTGEDAFDQNPYDYYYRLNPPDGEGGFVMGLRAHDRGFKRAALIFGSDIGSQGVVPTLLKGLKSLGSPQIVINEGITLDQSSYRTEIERMLAANPDVILTETDGQTAATFFSELKQLNGLIPTIGSGADVEPTWCRAMQSAVGPDDVVKYFESSNSLGVGSGAAWQLYASTLMAHASEVKDAQSDVLDNVAQARYNFVNLVALAMIEANSTRGSDYNKYIVKLTQGSPGAVQVGTYKDGKAALAAGTQIQYMGLGSGLQLDKWHNSAGDFDIEYCKTSGNGDIGPVPGTTPYTAATIAALASKS
jgi:branched-chain amino acid transport system substrate-binding protein